MKFQNLFFIAAGIFSILGAVLKWPFFMRSGKARGLAKLVGETGTRIFYIIIGIILVILGVFLIATGG